MTELFAEIDFREVELGPQKEILKAAVESEHVVEHDVKDLEDGDIVFNDVVCIERKRPGDFISSMKSGHLEDQVMSMYDSYDHVYVLVSGNMDDLRYRQHTKMNWDAVRAFIASLSVRWQVTPLLCGDERNLAFTAIDLARKSFEPLERQPGSPDVQIETDLGPVGQAALLADDVGPETARRIEECDSFWKVSDLCSASVQDLSEIDGIGPKTASKIKGRLQ